MKVTTRIFTAPETSHRILCATMKSAVKAQAVALRAHRQSKGIARDGYWLSTLQEMKAKARARNLIYGFVRGHDRERMENVEKSKKINAYYLKKAWLAAQKTATAEFAEFAYTNDLIEKYLNG